MNLAICPYKAYEYYNALSACLSYLYGRLSDRWQIIIYNILKTPERIYLTNVYLEKFVSGVARSDIG